MAENGRRIMAKKMCQFEGCSNITERGKYCSEHTASRKFKRAKRKKHNAYHHENKPYYHSQRWKTVCAIVDLRENNCCQRCHRYVFGKYKHHHHIKPIKLDATLAFDPENIMLLCSDCHPIVEHEQEEKRPKVYPSYFTPPTPTQNG